MTDRTGADPAGKIRALALSTLLVVGLFAVGIATISGTAVANAPDPGSYDEILAGMNGNGSAQNPYVVTNVTELQALQNASDGNVTLGADIDASETRTWNGGKGFTPIEDWGRTGELFDGNGHSIDALYINRTNGAAGLFKGLYGSVEDVHIRNATVRVEQGGILAAESQSEYIRNVSVSGDVTTTRNAGGLVAVVEDGRLTGVSATGTVSGDGFVGGLVGEVSNGGYITNSSADVAVTGSGACGGFIGGQSTLAIANSRATGSVRCDGGQSATTSAGGFAGRGGEIQNSFATADVNVSGDWEAVGGFAGQIDFAGDEIQEAYSTGNVTVTGTSTYTGGFVGDAYLYQIDTAYWDVQSSTQETGIANGSGDVTGLGSLQMRGETARTTMSLSYGNNWSVVSDGGRQSLPYPLGNRGSPPPGTVTIGPGAGTESDPVAVSRWAQIENVSRFPGSYFQLGRDLNASTADYDAVNGRSGGLDPIGTTEHPFDSTFDGQNHTVSDLVIDRGSANRVGLFGVVGPAGTVSNLTVRDAEVTGDTAVGGLAGVIQGNVSNVTLSGRVDGENAVGGLAGRLADGGRLTDVESSVGVGAFQTGGGLVGTNGGIVRRAVARGNTTGSGTIGGLVGENTGLVNSSYAVVDLRGDLEVGGLVGANDGTLVETFAAGTVDAGSTASDVGGLAGENSGAASRSYWDTQNTTQSEGVGTGDADGITGLSTAEMTGGAAETNMALRFDGVWVLTPTYPALRQEDPARTVAGGIGVSSRVQAGTETEPVWLNATVEHTGNRTQGLTVTADVVDRSNGTTVASKTLTVGETDDAGTQLTELAGGRLEVAFQFDPLPPRTDLGDDYRARISADADNSAGASSKTTFRIAPTEAVYEVSFVDTLDSTRVGETAEFRATVTNRGGSAGSQPVVFWIEDAVVDRRVIDLGPSGSQTETFSYKVTSAEKPEVAARVSTDDDRATTTVPVVGQGEPTPTPTPTPEPAEPLNLTAETETTATGDVVTVSYTLRNTGRTDATSGSIDVEVTGPVLSADDDARPDRSLSSSAVPAESTLSTTYRFVVVEDPANPTVRLNATGMLTIDGETARTVETSTVSVETSGGLPTEPGEATFQDVLAVIEAFNEDRSYQGVDVEFRDVLVVIEAYNQS